MKKISSEERQRFLSEWKTSGKPVKQFCRENNLNHYTFYGWLEVEQKKPTEPRTFGELSLRSAQQEGDTSIAIGCGLYRIEISRGFDRVLKTLLEVLGSVLVS